MTRLAESPHWLHHVGKHDDGRPDVRCACGEFSVDPDDPPGVHWAKFIAHALSVGTE